jgi:hypothetical protein
LTQAVVIPIPYGLHFLQWGALVAEQLAQFAILAPDDEDKWREWGSNVVSLNDFAYAPSPNEFLDWREWACRFRETF